SSVASIVLDFTASYPVRETTADSGSFQDLPLVTGCRGRKSARVNGSPSPWTNSSSERVIGPAGLTTTTAPPAAARSATSSERPGRNTLAVGLTSPLIAAAA